MVQGNLRYGCAALFSTPPIVGERLHTTLEDNSLKQGGYYSYSTSLLDSLPLPMNYATQRVELGNIVKQIVSLNTELLASQTDHERTVIQRQIDATDKQIDALVYELYGLSEEEIKIVES
jgi:hypothetical protein